MCLLVGLFIHSRCYNGLFQVKHTSSQVIRLLQTVSFSGYVSRTLRNPLHGFDVGFEKSHHEKMPGPSKGCQIDGKGAIKQPLRVKHHPLEGAGARFAVFLVSGRLVGFTTISDMHAALLNTSLSPLFFPSLKYHTCTLPETNIAPENRPLEKEIPMETTIFRGSVSFRECMSCLDGSTL